MNAPLLESHVLHDVARGPQPAPRSSFTVKDILQRPTTFHSFSSGDASSVGSDVSRHGFFPEDRNRLASSSSLHPSDYDQNYGTFANFPTHYADTDRVDHAGQSSPFGGEELQSRFLSDNHGDEFLSFQARYQDIGTSDHLTPSGKRVHSVESTAETSASTSPSTLPPSPHVNVTNHQNFFSHKTVAKSISDSAQKHEFSLNNSTDVVFSANAAREHESEKFGADITDISSSYEKTSSVRIQNDKQPSSEALRPLSGELRKTI